MAHPGGDLAGDLPDRGGPGGGAGREGRAEGGGVFVGGRGWWVGTYPTLAKMAPHLLLVFNL